MYINNKDIFLISCNTLKQKSLINKNVDDDYILPVIKTAQDIYLREVIGDDLLTDLCTQAEAGTLSGKYKILVDQYITDYLTYKVTADIQIPLWSKIRNEGITTQQGTDFQNLTINEVTYTREYYDNLATSFIHNMEKYINDNISDFSLYNKYKMHNIKYNTHIYLG